MPSLAQRVALRFQAAVTVKPGTEGKDMSHQGGFDETTPCVKCRKKARMALVVSEDGKGDNYVTHVHPNNPEGEGYWPHDCAAFAIYICPDIDCRTATCIWDQS